MHSPSMPHAPFASSLDAANQEFTLIRTAFSLSGKVEDEDTAEIAILSGGADAESQARLDARSAEFNLKLVFSLKSRAAVTGVQVKIADNMGHTLVNTTTEGPWLLARVPAGTYIVVGAHEHRSMSKMVPVAADKLNTVDFQW